MQLFKSLSLLKYFVFLTIFVLISANFTLAKETIVDNLDADEIEVTGFYRVEKIDDIWWFITPGGEKFYSISVSALTQPVFCYDTETDFVNITTNRLQDWNINTIQGDTASFSNFTWITRFRFKQLSHLYDEGWSHSRIPDVFDPWWQNQVNQSAMKYASPLRNDTTLIGYFTDNEMKWGPDISDELTLLDVYISAAWYTAGKNKAVEFLKNRYDNDTDLFNQVWNMNINNFNELLNISKLGVKNSWRLRSGFKKDLKSIKKDYENLTNIKFFNKAKQDTIDFSRLVADKYFNITNNALIKADPNHLNLGVRFHLQGVPEEVLKVCSQYLDVISINYYRNNVRFYDPSWVVKSKKYDCVPLDTFLEKYSEIANKPIYIGEYSFHIYDGSTPLNFNIVSPSKPVFSQDERYKVYEWYAGNCFKSKYVVGLSWFIFYDKYDTYQGLIDNYNEPYTIFNEKMGKLHSKALDMHENAVDKIHDLYPFYKDINKIDHLNHIFKYLFGFISNNEKIKKSFTGPRYDEKIERQVCQDTSITEYDILVDDDGPADYSSIQNAIDNVSINDIIFVKEGIYKEKIIVNKPLKLIGNSSKNTIISGFHDDFIFTGDLPENNFVVTILSGNVTLKGFKLTSHGTFSDSSGNFRSCAGISLKKCDNCVFSDNIFFKLGGWNFGGGIIALQSSNLIIKNNSFFGIGGLGLIIDSSINSKIKNNNFINNTIYGIYLSQSDTIDIYNNLIEGSRYGMVFSKVINSEIYNNIFQDNTQKSLVLISSKNNKIINNNFTKTVFNILNNRYSSVMFFYEKGNHWKGNYWFEPRCLLRIIFGKVGYDSLKLSFEFDLKPANK